MQQEAEDELDFWDDDEWNDGEDELDFWDDDEWNDGEDDYAIDAATNCICGAWEFMDGQPIHVADCICGAD
jgi:hypothetical protein